MDEEIRAYKIISKKDLMPTLLLDLTNTINQAFIISEKNSFYNKVCRAAIKQMYILLSDDIERLEESQKEKFEFPDEKGTADREKWYRLYENLWNLARVKGHVGTEEKRLDFDSLIKTLKDGVVSCE